MRVVVVGAGISGLTCALLLRGAGHEVQVLAALPPERTTSAVAAALWYPYRALPQEAVTRWSGATLTALTALADVPGSGVRLRTGRELLRADEPDPWWRHAVPRLDRVPPADLPPGYGAGWLLTVPVVDMGLHLPWLVAQLHDRGVEVRTARLDRLTDAPDCDVVVDCAGLGAEVLAGDDTLVPVRGQVLLLEQTGVEQWLLDQTDEAALTYVVPRERVVVVGGTAQVGSRDTAPDPVTAEVVLERAVGLVPALRGARVLEHRVGLRPTRPAVRLERGTLDDGRPVVHDYGHGGAGVTLSHGCAVDVVGLVAAL